MLRQRMYHLVLYSLSPIQKGIQAYHAGIEYSLRYKDTEEYKRWSSFDKTVIILDGGSSNRIGYSEYDIDEFQNVDKLGTMEGYGDELQLNNISIGYFYEPDLNNATTSIAFLVNETVWDKEKYPNPEPIINESEEDFLKRLIRLYGNETAFLRQFLKKFKLGI